MKSQRADQLKAEATRALLTCRCGHSQTSHLHSLKTGAIVGRWLQCYEQGCSCKAFLSQLTAREKVQMDNICDGRVQAATLAAVMKHQADELPSHTTMPTLKYDPARAVRKPKKGKQPTQVRVMPVSAPNAGVSGLYRNGTATKTAKGKYLWEE